MLRLMRLCLLLVLLWQSLLSRRCLRDDGESASEVSVDVGDDHDNHNDVEDVNNDHDNHDDVGHGNDDDDVDRDDNDR